MAAKLPITPDGPHVLIYYYALALAQAQLNTPLRLRLLSDIPILHMLAVTPYLSLYRLARNLPLLNGKGLSKRATEYSVRVLMNKGFVRRRANKGYSLTTDGKAFLISLQKNFESLVAQHLGSNLLPRQ